MLDLRKRQILQAVVEDYIATAEPVGSRTLARKWGLGVSPATIRNEMADLEDAGYLDQPHTSAGRIPSDKGYRYYVDQLLEPEPPRPEEIKRIEADLGARREMMHLAQAAARLMAELSPYAALAVVPGLSPSRLRRIHLLPVDESHLLLVLVAEPGIVETRLLELGNPAGQGERERWMEALNQELAGLTATEFDATALATIRGELGTNLYVQVMDALHEVLSDAGEERLLMEGVANLLRQPEFQDSQRLMTLLQSLTGGSEVVEELRGKSRQPGVTVSIGRENATEAMRCCALVTAAYQAGGEVVGMVGVVGPTRMEYRRVLSLVNEVASELSRALGGA